MHTAAHQLALKLRCLAHEFLVLLVSAEAHHTLHAGAVVPAAVKQHNFTGGGQVLHIPLEVPLAAFHFSGLFQGHHAGTAWVQVLHETLDGTALARRIAAFEQDDDALAGFLGPGLQLEQLNLQQVLLLLVGFA